MLTEPDIAIRLIHWLPRLSLHITGAAWMAGATLKLFVGELAYLYPSIPDEDIEEQVNHFLSQFPTWRHWYASLLEIPAIKLTFYNSQPFVSQANIFDWRRITTSIDPDALITLGLVRRGLSSQLFRLSLWRTYPLCDDNGLLKLFTDRKGLADTHVHLEGSVCIPWLWQRIMLGETRVEQMPRYSSEALKDLRSDPRQFNSRKTERDTIKDAIHYRQVLIAAYESDNDFSTLDLPKPNDEHSYLWDERALLTWAWSRACAVSKDRCFDRYLTAKNLFIRKHTQSFGENPGLVRFRCFFKRAKEFRPRRSTAVEALRMGRLVDCAHDSAFLQKLTVRIAPFDSIGQYLRFFGKTLEEVLRKTPRYRETVRFIIHFIREPKLEAIGDVPFQRLYETLDRQSAVLHQFRLRYPKLAHNIIGIDVANYERKCPPAIFTPYFRLLRGDLTVLDETQVDSPYCNSWHRLKKQGLAVHPVDLPRLIFTYHAGEDFFHPIDGMRMMDEAICNAGFMGGDRIGHGLAAGWNIEEYNMTIGKTVRIPQGILLDNLVWLHRKLSDIDFDHYLSLKKLEELIRHYSFEIYGNSVDTAVAYRLLSIRHNLPGSDLPDDADALKLWDKELYIEECKAKRQKTVSLPKDFIDMNDAQKTVQEQFLKELAKKRIVVEFNPSSNVAVGHFSHLKEHPLFRYVEVQKDGLQASLNTDDPGVFAARIEMEYALMLDAMQVNGMSVEESYKTLERLRDCGLE